jgi:Trk K+ transport system NAD-binding subunit
VLTHVVEADSTGEEAMRQLGVADFSTAVVAIGTDLEASILSTGVLVDLGVEKIVAKAVTEPHGRILARIGAHRVVFPERDMGIRVGHSLAGSILDNFEPDPGFALVETMAPRAGRKDPRRRRSAQALRRHRRLHQAEGRLLHLRDARHRRAGGVTCSSSRGRRSARRASASWCRRFVGAHSG